MTDWADLSDLTPFDHLSGLLVNAADLLRDVAAKSGEITLDDELNDLLSALSTNVLPAYFQAHGELLSLLEHRPAA